MATVEQNGIIFNAVENRTVTRKGPSIITTIDQTSGGKYVYDEWNPIVMSLDIDWNGADLSDILGSSFSSIKTTGQLISAIKEAAQIASSTPGPQGPQGETGPQGPQGPQGDTPDSSEDNHYTPENGTHTYSKEGKVIESITVDSKGHITGVTFAPKVETVE